MELSSLTALSPLDGRYQDKTADLRPFFSEFGLIRYRVLVEIRWLMFLMKAGTLTPAMDETALKKLERLITDFQASESKTIKSIEKKTNHDVKAVEYYLQQQCQGDASLKPLIPFIHFGCTSEDINNLDYSSMIKEAIAHVLSPALA